MSNEGKSTWTKVAELNKSKAGKLVIKILESVDLKKGDALFLQDPRAKVKDSITAGRLTEEKGAEMLSKIPDFVKYHVYHVSE